MFVIVDYHLQRGGAHHHRLNELITAHLWINPGDGLHLKIAEKDHLKTNTEGGHGPETENDIDDDHPLTNHIVGPRLAISPHQEVMILQESWNGRKKDRDVKRKLKDQGPGVVKDILNTNIDHALGHVIGNTGNQVDHQEAVEKSILTHLEYHPRGTVKVEDSTI